MNNVNSLIARIFSFSLSSEKYNKLRFFHKHRKWPNLDNPSTFSEKLLKLKIEHNDSLMTKCADKNKNTECKKSISRDISRWLSSNYYHYGLEEQYKSIQPSVVIENLLVSESGKVPIDYKFYCFGKGGSKKIIIQLDLDRFDGSHKRAFFNPDWTKSEIGILSSKTTRIDLSIERPVNLAEMIQVAKKLSSEFEFSRIDLYNHNKNILFGEITFHPEAGYGIYTHPNESDIELGRLIDLPSVIANS